MTTEVSRTPRVASTIDTRIDHGIEVVTESSGVDPRSATCRVGDDRTRNKATSPNGSQLPHRRAISAHDDGSSGLHLTKHCGRLISKLALGNGTDFHDLFTVAYVAQRRKPARALFGVVVSPAASTALLEDKRKLKALPRDRSRRRVVDDLSFAWTLVEGEGTLSGVSDQEVEYQAPGVPGLTRLRVTFSQREVTASADALITVTDSLDPTSSPAAINSRGLPGYTFERAAGELWRCRFDADRNIIVVNSGHRDFVFATRNRALQLRYLVRLYVKELVLKNFAGLAADQLLERMIELSLYAEEKLKSG